MPRPLRRPLIEVVPGLRVTPTKLIYDASIHTDWAANRQEGKVDGEAQEDLHPAEESLGEDHQGGGTVHPAEEHRD